MDVQPACLCSVRATTLALCGGCGGASLGLCSCIRFSPIDVYNAFVDPRDIMVGPAGATTVFPVVLQQLSETCAASPNAHCTVPGATPAAGSVTRAHLQRRSLQKEASSLNSMEPSMVRCLMHWSRALSPTNLANTLVTCRRVCDPEEGRENRDEVAIQDLGRW